MKRRNAFMISLGAMAVLLLGGCSAEEGAATNGATTEEADSQAISMETVDLTAGKLIGYKEDNVYSFKGIPYATAERFKSPEPIESYDGGTHLALSYGQVAPQERTLSSTASPNPYEFMTPSNGTADMVGNENCQYLNVWSNSLEGNKPVIVFFHGGGLVSGASSELSYYTGEYFTETEDAVFVSVNHRLNALGFLDLSAYGEDYADSGIAGIQDCVEALHWVKNNISEFGGDPDNVTILGQSGGAEKVSTLASMSETVDLFDKVVFMSGYYATAPKEEGLANARQLVDYLQLADSEVIPTLTDMSYEELLESATNAGCNWSTHYGDGTFADPLFDENGEMNEYAANRKWMIGTTYSEFFTNVEPLIYGQNQDAYLPDIDEAKAMEMLTERYGSNAERIASLYKEAYPEHPLAEVLFINSIPQGGFSRYGLINPENGWLKSFNEAGATVYNYAVSYQQPYFGGVTMYHTGDIPYWFNSLDEVPHMIKGDEENARQVSEAMSNALGAFLETGDPSTEDLEWAPYSNDEHNTMVFDTNSETKEDFDLELYESLTQAAQ